MEIEVTVKMLADQLLLTNETLAKHVQGCEDGQRENSRLTLLMSEKVDAIAKKVDSVAKTVGGYQRVISGSWASVGKVLLGVTVAVSGAVAVLAIQNANLHKDTATRVDSTAQVLATQTAAHQKKVEEAQAARDERILDLLSHRR